MTPPRERLHNELDEHRQRGYREKVLVNYQNLLEIINDYDRLTAIEREGYEAGEPNIQYDKKLHNLIAAIFHDQGRDAVLSIMYVMERTLSELRNIEEKQQILKHLKAGYE